MAVNDSLRGRRALVTAASKGLGLATAEALCLAGCRVVLTASNQERVDAASAGLAGQGEVHGLACDLTNPEACARAVDFTQGTLGGIDILVNNCRGPQLGRAEDMSDSMWYAAIEMVLMSAVRLTRAALPLMVGQRRGSIVNLTSIAAQQPVPDLVLSNSLRPAVIGLGKTLAREAAPHVRVNSILTGRFATDRIREENQFQAAQHGITADAIAARSVANIPLGRYGHPDELAKAVLFLAGDDSSFITGATLAVDGGEHVGLF